MQYQIFRNSNLLINVEPDDNSELSQKKQTEDIIRLNFTLNSYVDIQVGDYISFEKTSQLYKINKRPEVIESPKNYQYSCIFEGPLHELKKTKVFYTSGTYKDYKFPLTGNAQTFLAFIVSNLNRNGGSYVAGNYKVTATQNIEFNNWNCFEAITELSNQLNFSWYLEGNILHFTDKPATSPPVFQVGRLLGFTSLTRRRLENEEIQTIVYGYGSTENLPPRISETGLTYNSPLLTENRLFFEGENGESKLSNNTAEFGNIESIQEYDEIKPERVGTITSVDSVDSKIIFDTSLDFDIELQKLPGILPKLTFITGKLLGLTFNISAVYLDNKIILDTLSNETGDYPNAIQKPEVGDQYVLVDIIMPQTYITEAATRLKEVTQAYVDTNSKELELYDGVVDASYIESKGIELNIGQFVRIISAVFGIDTTYEIKELTQSITEPSKYSIKFGDVIPKSLLALLKSANFTTQQEIYNIQKNTYTVNETNNTVTNIVGQDLAWEEL